MKYKLVYIEWQDAQSRSGWFGETDVDIWIKDVKGIVKTVGWLFRETKNYIVLGQGIDHTSDGLEQAVLNMQKIPKGWILKRKILKI